MTSLVPSGQPHDHDLDSLHSRLSALEATLKERTDGVAQARSALAAFRIRYRSEVGLLHEELDDLECAIAEAELGEMSKRLGCDGSEPSPSPGGEPREPPPRFTSDTIRRLFRDVAKTIHPDLAGDEGARNRRHTLMVEANRAYRLGDEARLRRILAAWENSPEAVADSDPDATRVRLVRRISQIQEALDACAGQQGELEDSPLWKLKVMVDEAAARGKDLVEDMVRRLKRDIMAARNRLDAMHWNP